MSEPRAVDDEELASFLDREVTELRSAEIERALAGDAALRDRSALLDEGGVRAKAAFAALMDEAPQQRLASLLERALQGGGRADVLDHQPGSHRRSRRLELLAATVAIFVLGGVVGGLITAGSNREGQGAPESWRQAVAEYWTLTTPATLAIPPPPTLAAAQLATAGSRLGLNLQSVPVKVQPLAFRGAALFDFRGRPLVQVAYLDPTYGPIAYCIITDPSRTSRPKTSETLDGFNIVHWARNGHARLLIGKAPIATLADYAERLDG